jgi:hypothetical protein
LDAGGLRHRFAQRHAAPKLVLELFFDTARAFDAAGNVDAARRLRFGIRQWERAMARVEERDWRGPIKRALRRIGVKR